MSHFPTNCNHWSHTHEIHKAPEEDPLATKNTHILQLTLGELSPTSEVGTGTKELCLM